MRAAAGVGYTTATDLADWLVGVKGAAFRDAHGIAARAVKAAEERSCDLHELDDAVLLAIDPRLDADVRQLLGVDASVASRTSHGGTAPERVKEAVVAMRRRLAGAGGGR
jgi:argininosuccinate lyase